MDPPCIPEACSQSQAPSWSALVKWKVSQEKTDFVKKHEKGVYPVKTVYVGSVVRAPYSSRNWEKCYTK